MNDSERKWSQPAALRRIATRRNHQAPSPIRALRIETNGAPKKSRLSGRFVPHFPRQHYTNQFKMKIALIFAVAGFSAARLAAAPVDWSKLPPASTVAGVTFDKDIAPILKDSCVRCHGAERPRAQLRLDSLDGVLQGAKQGPVVKTGDSANSLLVKAVSQLDPEIAMPPKPRARRGGPGGPPGTNAPAVPPREGGPGGGPEAGGPPPPGGPPPGGPGGTNAPGSFQPRLRPLGPPPKPLTAEQVGLIRAWIDQGAK
jgi:hypothetical protein